MTTIDEDAEGSSSSVTSETHTGESESPEFDKLAMAERQLRFALEHALECTPQTMGLSPVLGAIATLIDFDDPIDSVAYDMLATALFALAMRHEAARGKVNAWHTFRSGGSESNPDAMAIRDIAAAVEKTAGLYSLRLEWLDDKGRAVVEHLRESLVRRFSESVPSVDDLEEWISKYAHRGARGQLTNEGIVAKIVHRGRLLGAHTEDESTTLRRVDRVLARSSKRRTPLTG